MYENLGRNYNGYDGNDAEKLFSRASKLTRAVYKNIKNNRKSFINC
jgi:hypothetical protein